MPIQYTGNVVRTLARHLGVSAREIALAHDLYRDWGLTPLSLVVVLLDLEQSIAIELPCEEFSSVRTVADLVAKFRGVVHANERAYALTTFSSSRRSRSARNERRLRRELHRLRWLEQDLGATRALSAAARPSETGRVGAARREADG